MLYLQGCPTGFPHSPGSQASAKSGITPEFSVGTRNRELMEQGTSPTYSTVTAAPFSRPGAEFSAMES